MVRVELHPEKTKVVDCEDDDRRRTYPSDKFNFQPGSLGQSGKAIRIEI
jgi:hypothetical protein